MKRMFQLDGMDLCPRVSGGGGLAAWLLWQGLRLAGWLLLATCVGGGAEFLHTHGGREALDWLLCWLGF